MDAEKEGMMEQMQKEILETAMARMQAQMLVEKLAREAEQMRLDPLVVAVECDALARIIFGTLIGRVKDDTNREAVRFLIEELRRENQRRADESIGATKG